MSTRCNVKVTQNGRVDYLYHHMDGDLAYAGATVALAARKAIEGNCEDVTLWLLNNCPNKNFQMSDCQHMDIEYLYHIQVDNGNVKVGLATKEGYVDRNIEGETRNYKVKTFIKKVNSARRDTPLRKLRLPL